MRILSVLALASLSTPAMAASVADFTTAGITNGIAAFDVTLSGGDAAGTVISFFNPVRDCSAPCTSPDSSPVAGFNTFGGFRNSSGVNTGLYDVSVSSDVFLIGASALVSPAISNFLGLDITGGSVSESAVFAGLPDGGSETLTDGILLESGVTYSFNVLNSVATGTIGGVEFGSWTFEAAPAVPVPASAVLLVAALGALGATRAARKG